MSAPNDQRPPRRKVNAKRARRSTTSSTRYCPRAIRYVPRAADRVLREMIDDHPAVLLVGPRATGKTTSARRVAASAITLANDRERVAFAADIEGALTSRPEPILIDERQEVPASLGHIKTLVDADPRRGRFLVTGSVRGDVDALTWPGTGRVVRLEMYGLTEREIERRSGEPSWLEGVLHGEVARPASELRLGNYVDRALRSGFPEPALALDGTARVRWLTSYVDQLVTRDADNVDGGRDPARLRRFLAAYALNSAGTAVRDGFRRHRRPDRRPVELTDHSSGNDPRPGGPTNVSGGI